MYIYIYTHTYIHIYIYLYSIYMHIHIYTHVYIHYRYICKHVYIYIYLHIYRYVVGESRDQASQLSKFNGHRVLCATVAGARSALQALYMWDQGWGVEEGGAGDSHKDYWCDAIENGKSDEGKVENNVCSALQVYMCMCT